ncbi:hypothetical protein ACFWOS_06080 [Streptomyces rubiginosohelvolus]|uniref:hypothetical protein n=1 Tax=Streptomyces rubiginosohelvolus TaxID=67362 RepID=UPI00365552CE
MTIHLTEDRIAAALAAATQPEGETPWAELTTPPPMTHSDVSAVLYRAEHPEEFGTGPHEGGPTLRAEASRARIIQDLARRDSYLAALTAAKEMTATIPVLPVSVNINNAAWHNAVFLTFRFHRDADAVRQFADHLSVPVKETADADPENGVHVSAEGVTDSGVQFEAYTLIDAPAEGPHDSPVCGADLGPGYICRRPASHAGDCEPTADPAEGPQAVTA